MSRPRIARPLPFALNDWQVDERGYLHGPECRTLLSNKETALLHVLADEPNLVRSGPSIGMRLNTTTNAVHVFMSRLRRNMAYVGSTQDILTVRDGYMLTSGSNAATVRLDVTPRQMAAIREAVALAERQVPGISARTGLLP